MDKILDLSIAYPDFQLNQIIDPEQIDLNNSQMVAKINNLIQTINTFTQDSTGSSNITIKTLSEFPSAKNVQAALEQIATFAKNNKNIIDTIFSKNTSQDTEITNAKARLTAIETKNVSQDTEISTLKTHTSSNTTRIETLEANEVTQNTRIASIETREELDNIWVRKIDGRVEENKQAIQDVSDRLDEMSEINPSLEVIDARISGHTGEVFAKMGDRLDDLEIPISASIPDDKRSKVNFCITDAKTTETWENSVKLGSLLQHNEHVDAHPILIANHEMDKTSHNDIRRDILETKKFLLETIENTKTTLSQQVVSDETLMVGSGHIQKVKLGEHEVQINMFMTIDEVLPKYTNFGKILEIPLLENTPFDLIPTHDSARYFCLVKQTGLLETQVELPVGEYYATVRLIV